MDHKPEGFEFRSRWKKRPPEEMFRLSIIIIMITTIPVMSTAARRASIGFSLLAFRAGVHPKMIPTAAEL